LLRTRLRGLQRRALGFGRRDIVTHLNRRESYFFESIVQSLNCNDCLSRDEYLKPYFLTPLLPPMFFGGIDEKKFLNH